MDKNVVISLQKLFEALKEAYQNGWHGSLELDEHVASEIINHHMAEGNIVVSGPSGSAPKLITGEWSSVDSSPFVIMSNI